MFTSEQLANPSFKKLVRTCIQDEEIFREGQPGITAFLVINGIISVHHSKHGVIHLIGTIRAGEIIGERSLLDKKPYKRAFTAVARSETVLIEIKVDTLRFIEAAIPDFHMRVLRMALDRLDSANRLTNILQLNNATERLTEYVAYFHEKHCEGLPEEFSLGITEEEVFRAANVSLNLVEDFFDSMVDMGLAKCRAKTYFIKNTNKLKDALPVLRGRIEA